MHYNSKKTHCPQGHEYSGTNLGGDKHGRRYCKICRRAAQEKSRKIKKIDRTGICEICKTQTPLHRDHNHSCCTHIDKSCGNCRRGNICPKCNWGLGLFRDNISFLEGAIEYLRRYDGGNNKAF